MQVSGMYSFVRTISMTARVTLDVKCGALMVIISRCFIEVILSLLLKI